MTARDGTAAVDDGAERVHHGEHGDPRLSDPAEGAALSRRFAFFVRERLADSGRAPRAPSTERKQAFAGRPQRRTPELRVGIDGVLAPAEVVDDRSDDELDLVPA